MNDVVSLDPLTALSPLDGRYWEQTNNLAAFVSEYALIKTRFEVEAAYLIALSTVKIVRPFTKKEVVFLTDLAPHLTLQQAQRVKEIERETRHDVKAMERAFREFLQNTSLSDVVEQIHFGLTSEDINNICVRLRLQRALTQSIRPAITKIIDAIAKAARRYQKLPMLARTHGQAAVPTTLGKELVNFAVRLQQEIELLKSSPVTGKLNGAVGNYNALVAAFPQIDWINFSKKFISTLGLTPNLFTTQINPHEDVVRIFQTLVRINLILLDLNQDMWRYISDGWFVQEVKAGEVGSSTMPQKVNPINFENSEGNIAIANSVLEGMSRQLLVSRLQRDLSGSTVLRNIGTALGHCLLSYASCLQGLSRVRADEQKISEALYADWSILTESVQTILRREGITDPYRLIATLSRGRHYGEAEWWQFIETLPISTAFKKELKKITPATYIGSAVKLTAAALSRIAK